MHAKKSQSRSSGNASNNLKRASFFTPARPQSSLKKEPLLTGHVECPFCFGTYGVGTINMHIESSHPTEPIAKKKKAAAEISETSSSDLMEDEILSNLVPQEHPNLPGLWLIDNFISEEEENDIISRLNADKTPWHHSSFNGDCLSKCFGVRTQFGPSYIQERLVRVNDLSKGEYDIPEYLLPYMDRLECFIKQFGKEYRLPSALTSFSPNECNANCYVKSDKHYLTAHCDDRVLSGPVLMNLSLNGLSHMTYGNESVGHETVKVELPRRCLQLVTGPARFNYSHKINAEDIIDEKRMSITFRHSCPKGGLIKGQAPKNNVASIAALLTSSNN
jgi:alkylated DNA repair dioxygenase AlkB